VVELLALRIEVEADEDDAAAMTRRLAVILAERLDRGDEALAALTELADQGNQELRQAYVELGDKLGWKGIVAQKMVEWFFDAKHGPDRTANLRGAFERFAEVGRDQDAVRVAVEVIRAKGADAAMASRLEGLAVKTGDLEALETSHELLSRELPGGTERATELVRQAEVRVKAGMPRADAIQHGESGLAGVPSQDALVLLDRLALLAEKNAEIVDLYERQVTRTRAPADRVHVLARAAQVAAARGQADRARTFFELALSSTASDDTLARVEKAAREGDAQTGGERLRRALCSAMGAGGQGAKDGGRTRGALLRRAASMAHRDLGDIDQAFVWLGDALIAHVDPLTLDALESLGREVGDASRAELTLGRALMEVFDGPLVRQLLSRRAKIRREQLNDRAGAAADMKKLFDLSPTDQAVLVELSTLLMDLGDYRGMVQLYEDQILRGKDMNARAELARKVARMWEEQLADPREAADAWRRVLRMKQGDAEATAGLERAKSNMLKKPGPEALEAYAPPQIDSATMQTTMPVAAVSLSTAVDDEDGDLARFAPHDDDEPTAARPADALGPHRVPMGSATQITRPAEPVEITDVTQTKGSSTQLTPAKPLAESTSWRLDVEAPPPPAAPLTPLPATSPADTRREATPARPPLPPMRAVQQSVPLIDMIDSADDEAEILTTGDVDAFEELDARAGRGLPAITEEVAVPPRHDEDVDDESEDVVIADDLADIIDVEDGDEDDDQLVSRDDRAR